MNGFDAWRAGGVTYSHGGHDIFYRDGRGSGAGILLCLHGFPTASWDWHAIWPGLLARFERVIAPDLIGYGWSAKPADHDYSIHDQADLVEGLLSRLNVPAVHVLAHDYSVSVTQELLARQAVRPTGSNSARVSSVAFLNGGLFPEMHRPRRVQKLLLGPFGPVVARLTNERALGRTLAGVFGPDTKPGAAEIHEFWRLVEHDNGHLLGHKLIRYITDRRRHRDRWVSALTTADVPIRLIAGPEDPVSGAHLIAHYREHVLGADVVTLERIGHYPQVEAPDATLAAFAEFHDNRVGQG